MSDNNNVLVNYILTRHITEYNVLLQHAYQWSLHSETTGDDEVP